eukprot:m.207241 g.207241  ORF g.207241 m.207241 type:complete len:58 (+) comp13761_c1_seq2:566-739(+)
MGEDHIRTQGRDASITDTQRLSLTIYSSAYPFEIISCKCFHIDHYFIIVVVVHIFNK